MATIDEQYLKYMVENIVEHNDDIKIERTEDDRGILLELSVNPEDLGRVIGKGGKTAQAMRDLLRALGMKNNDHYHLKIVNTDGDDSRVKSAKPVESTDGVVKNTTENSAKNDEKVETVAPVNVENSDDEESDLIKSTRAELAELDDLDV